jgi:uncharacterized protein (TIGR00251 family)
MSKIADCIKKYKDGALLDIFVTPNAKQVIFPAAYNPWRKRIEIKVKSQAKGNEANLEVIKTISKYFLKPTTDVKIISGEKKKEKTLFIGNILINEMILKLRKSLNGL